MLTEYKGNHARKSTRNRSKTNNACPQTVALCYTNSSANGGRWSPCVLRHVCPSLASEYVMPRSLFGQAHVKPGKWSVGRQRWLQLARAQAFVTATHQRHTYILYQKLIMLLYVDINQYYNILPSVKTSAQRILIKGRAVIEHWMITFAAYTAATTPNAFQWIGRPPKLPVSSGISTPI